MFLCALPRKGNCLFAKTCFARFVGVLFGKFPTYICLVGWLTWVNLEKGDVGRVILGMLSLVDSVESGITISQRPKVSLEARKRILSVVIPRIHGFIVPLLDIMKSPTVLSADDKRVMFNPSFRSISLSPKADSFAHALHKGNIECFGDGSSPYSFGIEDPSSSLDVHRRKKRKRK